MNRNYSINQLSVSQLTVVAIVVVMGIAAGSYGMDSYGMETRKSNESSNRSIPRAIAIPEYDPRDPTHRLIQNDGDWSSINDLSITHFYVAPGDYTDFGRISIRSSGTASQPRTLAYFDPSNPSNARPPIQLPANRRALIGQLEFSNASYWVVHRLAIRSTKPPIWFHDGSDSDHNVFDQLMVDGDIKIWDKADYNSFQSSFFTNNRPQPGLDANCVSITSTPDETSPGPIGNRFVDNEFKDCAGDGIQFVHRPQNLSAGSFAEGTRIANNDFYITPALYSDCRGNLSADGDCACAENGVDIKSSTAAEGDVPPQRWIHVTENRFWGFRRTDTACGGTGSDGSAVLIHNPNADYILFKGNRVWDSAGGLETSKFADDRTDHVSLIDNVFYDIAGFAYDGRRGSRYEAFFNTFVNTNIYLKIGHYNYDTGFEHDFMCNVMVNAGRHDGNRIDVFRSARNAYYNTQDYTGPGDGDLNFGSAAASANVPLCMRIARWSGPREFCIPYGRATRSSPHWRLCPTVSGTRDRGVDNEPVQNPWTDDQSLFSVSGGRAPESSASVAVKVTLSPAASQSAKVSIASVSTGSARPGQDYYGAYRVLTFDPGETEKWINVAIIDDNQNESDERFDVRIFRPENARIQSDRATVVIEDDDAADDRGFTLSPAEVIEGQSTQLTVRRLGDTSAAARVHISTSAVSGGAVPGQDYYGFHRILEFPPGARSRQIEFVSIDDDVVEPTTEAVWLRLFRAEGDSINSPRVSLLIRDND